MNLHPGLHNIEVRQTNAGGVQCLGEGFAGIH